MGMLVNGEWHDVWYDTESTDGKFIRSESQYRAIEINSKDTERYHLYVSYACPWAHRTLIMRSMKSLEDIISYSVVDPVMLGHGWIFTPENPDHINQHHYLYQVYTQNDPNYSGRVTVPVLWDKKEGKIVNNESSEIIRIMNTAWNDVTDNQLDYYPEHIRNDIDEVNGHIYNCINNGVYRCGFATTQSAYEEAFDILFDALNKLDQKLKQSTYLLGDDITEADIRLFTTLVRFDAVYFGHFKCNLKPIADYKYIQNYLERLFSIPAFSDTTQFDHIKTHYYVSHRTINPTGIVPKGPKLDWVS